MKPSELPRALAVILKHRSGDLALPEALNAVRVAYGEEPLTDKRARAGRAGGARSVEARRAANGTAQPRSKPEAKVEAPPEANTEASSKQNACASVDASAEPRLARKQDLTVISGFSGSGSEISEPPFVPQRRRKHPIPEDFEPHAAQRRFASENALDVDERARAFVAHHKARGTLLVDWDAAFDEWLQNALRLGMGRRDEAPGLKAHAARTGRHGSALEKPSVPRKPPPERRDLVPMSPDEILGCVDVTRAAMEAATPPRPSVKTTTTPETPSAAGAAE